MKEGWKVISIFSRTHSFMWRGKDCGEVLQALMAQVRKLRVSSFILIVGVGLLGLEGSVRALSRGGRTLRCGDECESVRGGCHGVLEEIKIGDFRLVVFQLRSISMNAYRHTGISDKTTLLMTSYDRKCKDTQFRLQRLAYTMVTSTISPVSSSASCTVVCGSSLSPSKYSQHTSPSSTFIS